MQSEASGAMHQRPQELDNLAVSGEMHTSSIDTRGGLRPDMAEFVGAFLAGAAIGAGTMFLLRPEPKRGRARIRKDLAPYGRRVRKNALSARRNFAAGADAASEAAEALGQASRMLIQDLREEVAEIVGTARDDLSDAVNEQISQALKIVKRGTRLRGRR